MRGAPTRAPGPNAVPSPPRTNLPEDPERRGAHTGEGPRECQDREQGSRVPSSRGAVRHWASPLTSLGPVPSPGEQGLQQLPSKVQRQKLHRCLQRGRKVAASGRVCRQQHLGCAKLSVSGGGGGGRGLGSAWKPPARALLTSSSGWARTRSLADCGSCTRCPSTSSGMVETAASPAAGCQPPPPAPRPPLRPTAKPRAAAGAAGKWSPRRPQT